MYGPCSLHFLLCHNVIPRVFHYSSRRAGRGDSQLGYRSVCSFFPAEVIMFLFSRSFFSYQGKLRVVPGQLWNLPKVMNLEFLNCWLYTKESALVKNIILELGMYCFSPSYYNYVLVIKVTTANIDIKWWIVACSFSLNLENKGLSIPCMSARSKSMVD